MSTFRYFLNTVSSLKIKLLKQKALLNFEFMWNEPMLGLKLLALIPYWLWSYALVIVAALVNLQFPLIKESCDDNSYE